MSNALCLGKYGLCILIMTSDEPLVGTEVSFHKKSWRNLALNTSFVQLTLLQGDVKNINPRSQP